MSKIVHLSGSDHIAQDLLEDGPQTFTITGVTEVTMEGERKRHAIELAEIDGKTWVPALTVLKALTKIWTRETRNWVGQKVTLYRDPDVKIGREVVGGIRVSHITGIAKRQKVTVRGAQNRPVAYTFDPLDTPPQADPIEQSLKDAWDDSERLQKAVQWLSDNNHPLHQKAADRLAELEGEVQS